MDNNFSPGDKEKIEKFNRISGLCHRSTAYDLTNTKDLKEMLKMKVCALMEYTDFENILDDLQERFDESIEYFDTRTWLSYTMNIEKPDDLLLKCNDSIGKANDDLSKLVVRTSEELKNILWLVLGSNAKIQKAVLGFDVEKKDSFEIIIEEIIENIFEVENSENMNDSFKNFLKYFKDICFSDEV